MRQNSHLPLITCLGAVTLAASLWGCALLGTDQNQAAAPPVQPIPFDEAVLKAANDLFSRAPAPDAGAGGSAKQCV